jgi:5-hydroxyisourate hydrolase-like protein (transthyretin family)
VTVTVLDEETGEPATGVTVTKSVGDGDSRAIGTTNADGVVRTLSPAESYRITVVDEPRVVVVDGLRPIPTPRLVDDE